MCGLRDVGKFGFCECLSFWIFVENLYGKSFGWGWLLYEIDWNWFGVCIGLYDDVFGCIVFCIILSFIVVVVYVELWMCLCYRR